MMFRKTSSSVVLLSTSIIFIIALAILSTLTTTPVSAVVVRRRVVTKPPDGEVELPPFNAQPFVAPSVFFSWTIRLDNITRTWILSGRFNFTQNAWFGIGLKSTKRMGGPLIICYIDGTTSNAACDDYYAGQTYNRPQRTYSGRTVATDADVSPGGDGYIVFDTRVQLGNESDDEAMILRDDFSRVIFARGVWDSAASRPNQHAADEVAAVLVNFDSGEVKKFEADSHKITFFVLAAVVPLSAVVGFIDTNRHFPRAPKDLRVYLQIGGIAAYLGLMIMYIALRYNDYVEKVAGKAMWRAIGDGATFVLSCMLLPVSKRGLFHDGYGISHEKAIKYHAFQAVLLVLLAIIHMSAWIKFYSFDWIVRWAERDRRSHLPGLLTLITAIAVIGPALMRHRNWRMFRFTHYGVVIVYFFAVLHFPPLAYGVTPSLLLHLAATAVTRYRETYDFRQGIESAYFDEAAGLVSIDIIRSCPVRPGKYFMLRLPELNSGELHPFSVAKMFPIGSNADPGLCQHRVAHLSTALGDDEDDTDPLLTHPPLSGQLTSDLIGAEGGGDGDGGAAGGGGGGGAKQAEDWCILRLMIKVSKDKNSWTARLAQFLKQKQIQQGNFGLEMVPLPFASFRLNGPYGRLEINPAVYCQFVFIAGGVGINPLLYTLQCMSLGMIEYTGDPLGYLSINVYWIVRDEAMYESYITDLLQCKKRIEKLSPSVTVHMRVIMTGKDLAVTGNDGGAGGSQQRSASSKRSRSSNLQQAGDAASSGAGNHVPAILDAKSERLLRDNILTERTGQRPDFMEIAKDASRRCRAAAADPRHIIAAEDTTPEREALLREAVAVLISGPQEMSDGATVGFKTVEQAAQENDDQPLSFHIEQFRYSI